ncbi:MAG: alpha/beta fold hydrolase, partial [Stackebrandtia sp.]
VDGMTYHAFTATDQAVDDYLEDTTLPDRLTTVDKPLLVIFGKEDKRWKSSSAADYRTVSGAKVELLPGTGHTPMLEDPSRSAELLLDFTANHEERPG